MVGSAAASTSAIAVPVSSTARANAPVRLAASAAWASTSSRVRRGPTDPSSAREPAEPAHSASARS